MPQFPHVEKSAHLRSSQTSAQSPDSGIPLYVGNRIAGFVMPDHSFFKRVSASVHLNRKLGGYGANDEVLAALEVAGIERVRFRDSESGDEFFTTIAVLRRFGQPFYHRSYGAQTILPLRFWQRRLPDGTVIQPDVALAKPQLTQQPTDPPAQQLSLFEGA